MSPEKVRTRLGMPGLRAGLILEYRYSWERACCCPNLPSIQAGQAGPEARGRQIRPCQVGQGASQDQ